MNALQRVDEITKNIDKQSEEVDDIRYHYFKKEKKVRGEVYFFDDRVILWNNTEPKRESISLIPELFLFFLEKVKEVGAEEYYSKLVTKMQKKKRRKKKVK